MAVVVGPVLGGAVVEGLAWRWIFWLNVPLVAVAIPLVRARVPEGYGPPARLDGPGLVLGAASCLGLVWGLIRGNGDGWGSPPVLAALGVGLVAAVAFGRWQRRAPAPLLPPRLFRSAGFTAGNVVIFLLNGALLGTIFFTAQYLQVGAGHGALGAGLRLLPWGVAPLLLAPRAGALAERFGQRLVVVVGMAVFTVSLAGLALVAGGGAGWALPGLLALAGVGAALAIPAATAAVVASVAPADLGTASGVYSTARQLGGAFGVALGGAVFAATGAAAPAQRFTDGYRPAVAAAAVLALAGTVAAFGLRRRGAAGPPVRPAAAGAPTSAVGAAR